MDTEKPAFISRMLTPALHEPQEAVPQVLILSGGVGLSLGAWGAFFYWNADGVRGIFEDAGRVWATVMRQDPP